MASRASNWLIGILAVLGVGLVGGKYFTSTDKGFEDNVAAIFGTDSDATLMYDEATDDRLELTMATAAADTNGPNVRVKGATGGAHTSNNPTGGDLEWEPGEAGSGGSGRAGRVRIWQPGSATDYLDIWHNASNEVTWQPASGSATIMKDGAGTTRLQIGATGPVQTTTIAPFFDGATPMGTVSAVWGESWFKGFKSNSGLGITLAPNLTTSSETRSLGVYVGKEVHALAAAGTSTTTAVDVPAGAMILGASFNVDAAVTDSAGDDTWTAALQGGSTTTLTASAVAAAQNSKHNVLIAPEIATAETNVTFTANGGSFTSGTVEVVVYYISLTSLSNAP